MSGSTMGSMGDGEGKGWGVMIGRVMEAMCGVEGGKGGGGQGGMIYWKWGEWIHQVEGVSSIFYSTPFF